MRPCGAPVGRACSPRWRRRTSTCSCVGREGERPLRLGRPAAVDRRLPAFGPGCVLVRGTGAVHLLSTWDEGIPDDIPHENLYGISFNAGNFLEGAPGDRRRRNGADGGHRRLTPRRPGCCPRPSRRPSSSTASRCCAGPAGSRRPRRSTRSAPRSPRRTRLGEAVSALAPGVTERQLTGVFMEAMASAGRDDPRRRRTSPGSPRASTHGTAPAGTRRSSAATWWRSTPG